ncbi:MAG: ADOP family duplicated permease [Thermoanaerobaculia bacterium]
MTQLPTRLATAFGSLRRDPAYALTASILLTLGIGATALVWIAFDAVVLRPLPFPDSHRLVAIYESHDGRPAVLSPPNFADLRAQSRSFTAAAAVNAGSYALSATGSAAEQVSGSAVTAEFFRVLGVDAAIGRALGAIDDAPEAATVVLSDALWRRRYGADPALVGRRISVDGVPRTVVGVMPRGFSWPLGSELWLPLSFSADELRSQRGAHYLDAVARLAPGTTVAAASAELATIGDRLAVQYPSTNGGQSALARPLADQLTRAARPTLLLLLGAVALALVAACANLASVSLARAVARGHDLAVRAALGASPSALARELLGEAILVAAAGAVGGGLLATALARSLPAWAGDLPRIGEASFDLPAALFAAALAGLCGLAVGLAPALLALRLDPIGALRAGARTILGQRGVGRARRALVVATTTFAFVLVSGSLVVARSYAQLAEVHPGFATTDLLTFSVGLPQTSYDTPEKVSGAVTALRERLAALPGVRAVAAEFGQPFADFAFGITLSKRDGVEIPDAPDQPSAQVRVVTPGYFALRGTPVRSGREFAPGDRWGGENVVLLNESAARSLYPGVDPLGHSLELGFSFYRERGRAGGNVVGVVGDVRDQHLESEAPPTIYLLHDQLPATFLTFTVAAQPGQLDRLSEPVRREVAALDADLPIFRVRPLATLVADTLARRRFAARLLAGFAGIAITLALVGLFGILATSISERRRELAVRGALGATPRALVAGVLGQAARLIAVGIGVGLAALLPLAPYLAPELYRISPTDPPTVGLAVVAVAIAGLVIAWIPARRASRIEPAAALRAE